MRQSTRQISTKPKSGPASPINAAIRPHPTYNTCYPPAVNYTPLYYLINGVAFDKTNARTSLFSATSGTAPAAVLRQRAGALGECRPADARAFDRRSADWLAGCAAAAPAGPLPDRRGRQSAARHAPACRASIHGGGQDLDVMINVPAAAATALPIFDRQLSLSANAHRARCRHARLHKRQWSGTAGRAALSTAAIADPDSYPPCCLAQPTLHRVRSAKGVIANDSNVYGVKVLTRPRPGTLSPQRERHLHLHPRGADSRYLSW